MTTEDEARLITRFKDGDRVACEELFQRYEPRILQLARRTLRQPEAACDVTQEVFLRALQALSRWRGEARFSTWLYRTTLYVCSECIRNEERQRRVRERSAWRARLAVDLAAEDSVVGCETRQSIDRAVAQLPPRQRAVFQLRQRCGLSFREVARRLEMTEGGVKASYHKAVVALRGRLRSLAPDAVRV